MLICVTYTYYSKAVTKPSSVTCVWQRKMTMELAQYIVTYNTSQPILFQTKFTLT